MAVQGFWFVGFRKQGKAQFSRVSHSDCRFQLEAALQAKETDSQRLDVHLVVLSVPFGGSSEA